MIGFLLTITGYVLAVLVLLALIPFLFALRAKRYEARQFANGAMLHEGPAPLLSVDGVQFRDLNRNGKLDIYEDPRAPLEARVEDLLSQMTIGEKIGLMFHPQIVMTAKDKLESGLPWLLLAGEPTTNIAWRGISHFNIIDTLPAADFAAWTNQVQRFAERTRLGIPVTFSTDPRNTARGFVVATSVASGDFSRWPEPLGIGALNDVATAEQFGRMAGAEYRATGIHVALHPMADLATEPRWPRIVGTFGEDADRASRMLTGYMRGFQGDTLSATSVITMVKHFPGGGAQEGGTDPHFSEGRFQAYPGGNFNYHLKPFEAAFAAGTYQIMPYYGIPKGQTSEEVAFAFNKEIITDLLRGKYGFDGVVCADWSIITPRLAVGPFGFAPSRSWGVDRLSVKKRLKKAIEAGIDQFGGEFNTEALNALVRSGAISEERINASARRVLRDKFRLGLFDNPYVDEARAADIVGSPDKMQAGLDAQIRSQVLLKNDMMSDGQPFLPLRKGQRIYVEGLESSALTGFGKMVKKPDQADVAIISMRAPRDKGRLKASLMETVLEANFSRGDLRIPAKELARLQSIASKVPTVVCIYLDRPAILTELQTKLKGLIGHYGAGDDAIAAVLFGDGAPEGTLPVELPSSWDAVLAQKEDVPYDSKDPLYRFGYGLRYANKS